MTAGALDARVAFDAPVMAPDGYGGQTRTWAEALTCWAELVYDRGREAVQAGGLTGSAVLRVRVRANAATRAITTDYRMRDLTRGIVFNVRESDPVTDPAFVWLRVEQGVAV